MIKKNECYIIVTKKQRVHLRAMKKRMKLDSMSELIQVFIEHDMNLERIRKLGREATKE